MNQRSFWSPLLLLLVLSFPACRHDVDAAKREALERGNAYFAQKKYAEAAIEFRRAVQEDMRFGEAHFRLGLTYELQGDRPNALREFGNAANVMPERRDVQLKAGQYYLFAGKFDDARKLAERLLDKNVRDVDAQLMLASALAGLNDLDAAARQVEEAIRVEPSNPAGYSNLAALELARDNPGKAEDAFKNALKIAPQSVDARVGLASMYWATGRLPEAEKTLTEAVAVAPDSVIVNRTLAALYLSTGRPAQAEAPLKRVAQANPGFVAAQLALADYYLSMKRTDEGLAILRTLASTPEGATPASLRMAQYDFIHGKKPEAYDRVGKLIAADSKNPQPRLVKAAFELTDGKADAALATAKAAVTVSPRLARAHFAVGAIESRQGKIDEARAAYAEALRVSPRFAPASLELAKIDLALGQLDSAVHYADTAVAQLPQNPDAPYTLVKALMARGDTARAGQELEALRARFGTVPRVEALTGRQALMAKDRDRARKAFEQALKLEPGNEDALAGLVELDLDAGRPTDALRRAESQLASSPKDPAALALAGRAYSAAGLSGKAEEAWRELIEVDPGALEVYVALGRLYYQQNRLDRALAEVQRLVQQQPRSASANTMMGFLLELQGKLDEAQQYYQKALEVDPRSGAAANNLAWLYTSRGLNLDVALQLAQTAKAALPDLPEVNDTLGWTYLKKGLRESAIGPLEQAVRLMPKKAVYHYHLGMAYLAVNDWSRARTSLEQALSLDPKFNGAADARKALSSIQ